MERVHHRLRFRIALGKIRQHANPPHALTLLRAHRERPRRRTAERGYQFPPTDGDWHVPLSRVTLLLRRTIPPPE